jgi:tetratricopeptide (TPR) repeat protein
LPEPHYHLARYYEFYDDPINERVTLEAASRAFDNAKTETPKRIRYRIDTQLKLANLMIASREFIPAEECLVKGIGIYEDAVTRRPPLIARSPEFGKLYADLGDIEYFAKDGDMARAQEFYLDSETNGYMPPEIEYRLGASYYRQENFKAALERFFNVSKEIQFNRRLLNTLGVSSFANSDFFAAEAYFKRLLVMLQRDRDRLPVALPDDVREHRELLERMMMAHNNMGVTLNALAGSTGRPSYRSQALGEFSESVRIADALGRDQRTMIRPGLLDPGIPGTSLPYLNIRGSLYPTPGASDQLYVRVDSDVLEPSEWEERMSLAYKR